MSLNWQADVKQFQQKFGFTVADKPVVQCTFCREFRERLIREEIKELFFALSDGDLTEIADGIADAIYVLLGTAVSYGINLQPIWDEVHHSNMEKVEGPERGDGTKPLKPYGWNPPSIAELIREQQRGR